MATLTVSQMLQYIQNFIKAKYPQVDVQPGTDLYDLLFLANAQVARRIFDEIDRLQNNQSVLTATSSDLDLIARNFNVERKPASYATGEVTFFTKSFSSDIVVPSGSIVGTQGTNVTTPIRFVTTKSAGMSVSNKAIYYDATAVRYQVKAPIQAQVAGTSGNVDSQIITNTVTPISGIDGVVNDLPTSGGTEQENDASLQQRCLQSFVVSNVGTVYGYRKLLQDNFAEVFDVYPIGPFDANAVRQTGVDIYTITNDVGAISNNVQATETFVFNTGDPGYTPLNRPVITVDSVDGTALGVARSFIPYPNSNADFQFIRDFTGERALSVQSADRINWLPLGIKPSNGSTVFITYTYNKKIQDVQNFMDRDENKVVGADALIKTGLKAKAYLKLSVKYFDNVDTDAAQTKVSGALSQFLSEMKFNESLELSDLVVVAQLGKWTDFNITEVDYVVFDESYIHAIIDELSVTRYMVNGVLTINPNEYIREGSITFV